MSLLKIDAISSFVRDTGDRAIEVRERKRVGKAREYYETKMGAT